MKVFAKLFFIIPDGFFLMQESPKTDWFWGFFLQCAD